MARPRARRGWFGIEGLSIDAGTTAGLMMVASAVDAEQPTGLDCGRMKRGSGQAAPSCHPP